MKILIAEDDEAIMTTYKLLLESRNHEVYAAYDGEECMMIFTDHNNQMRRQGQTPSVTPFDLVILDHRMPKKSGMEAAGEILSMVSGQRIIIASAYTSELRPFHDSDELKRQRIEVLQKPFELDVFLDLVERRMQPSAGMSGPKKSTTSFDEHFASTGQNNLDHGRDDTFTMPDSTPRL